MVVGLLILFLFFLEFSFLLGFFGLSTEGFSFTFSNCLRSMVFPVNLGPSNFLYCVFIVSGAGKGSASFFGDCFSKFVGEFMFVL